MLDHRHLRTRTRLHALAFSWTRRRRMVFDHPRCRFLPVPEAIYLQLRMLEFHTQSCRVLLMIIEELDAKLTTQGYCSGLITYFIVFSVRDGHGGNRAGRFLVRSGTR